MIARMRRRTVGWCCVATSLLATAAWASGPDFQINEERGERDGRPDVAALEDGFVVVWDGRPPSTFGDRNVRARRLDPGGVPLAAQLDLTRSVPATRLPRVAPRGDGFVVLWQELGGVPPRMKLGAFDRDGAPLGADLAVSDLPGEQSPGGIAARPDGGFVATWGQWYPSPTRIGARLFDRELRPEGVDFEVSAPDADRRSWPTVAAAPDGGMLVVWDNRARVGSTDAFSIHARRLASDGSPLAADFAVSRATVDVRAWSQVAAQPDAGFVVAWSSYDFGVGPKPFGQGVRARRIAGDGRFIGAAFQVNDQTADPQLGPQIAVDALGGFVVTWESGLERFTTPGVAGTSVQARVFASDGTPLGGDFQVNTYTTYNHTGARVASTPGGFVAAWTVAPWPSSYGGGDSAVRARALSDVPGLSRALFVDGFEGGDASRWGALEVRDGR